MQEKINFSLFYFAKFKLLNDLSFTLHLKSISHGKKNFHSLVNILPPPLEPN